MLSQPVLVLYSIYYTVWLYDDDDDDDDNDECPAARRPDLTDTEFGYIITYAILSSISSYSIIYEIVCFSSWGESRGRENRREGVLSPFWAAF